MSHCRFRILLVVFCVVLAPAAARAQDAPTWIERSNAFTRQLLLTDAQFEPEDAAQTGLEQFDGKALDLGPQLSERLIAAEQKQRDVFTAALALGGRSAGEAGPADTDQCDRPQDRGHKAQ